MGTCDGLPSALAPVPQALRASARHLVADEDRDNRPAPRPSGSASAAWKAGPMLAQFPHAAEHRDAARRPASAPSSAQRGAHRGRIGVVAFVDQQRVRRPATGDPMPRAAALEPAHLGQRQARPRRDRRRPPRPRAMHGERIGRPSARRARRRCSCSCALAEARRSPASRRWRPARHRAARTSAPSLAPKVQHLAPHAHGRAAQPVAMRAVDRDDRGAARLQALEDLGLGVGDRFLAAEDSRCAPGRSW